MLAFASDVCEQSLKAKGFCYSDLRGKHWTQLTKQPVTWPNLEDCNMTKQRISKYSSKFPKGQKYSRCLRSHHCQRVTICSHFGIWRLVYQQCMFLWMVFAKNKHLQCTGTCAQTCTFISLSILSLASRLNLMMFSNKTLFSNFHNDPVYSRASFHRHFFYPDTSWCFIFFQL